MTAETDFSWVKMNAQGMLTHLWALAHQQAQAVPGADPALLVDAVMAEANAMHTAASKEDGRAAMWRVRIRLYRENDPDTLQADSDPDLSPDLPGTMVIDGLPKVGQALHRIAFLYHSQEGGDPALQGLDSESLKQRIKSLRPTLSRRGGSATWRVPYVVRAERWIARVDVCKA